MHEKMENKVEKVLRVEYPVNCTGMRADITERNFTWKFA